MQYTFDSDAVRAPLSRFERRTSAPTENIRAVLIAAGLLRPRHYIERGERSEITPQAPRNDGTPILRIGEIRNLNFENDMTIAERSGQRRAQRGIA